MQEEHKRELAKAAEDYVRAKEAVERASARLADAMRAAYQDKMKQSEILRAANHVWSREYLRIVLGLARKKEPETE